MILLLLHRLKNKNAKSKFFKYYFCGIECKKKDCFDVLWGAKERPEWRGIA